MKHLGSLGVGVCAVLLAAVLARGDVKVVIDHNDNDHATAEFKFKQVPHAARDDAGSKAKFSIVDGDKDDNSADLDALNDGKLPDESDQPNANFFFSSDTDHGRLAVDLGSVIDVKQINTYSWHPDTRGLQVYTVYGSDGAAGGFNGAPKKEIDPQTCGWKLITRVDTHTQYGSAGGQYGVSISDTAGSIGKYRYLLFAISKGTPGNVDGNTFFSEIDVVDASEMLGDPVAGTTRPGVKQLSMENGKYTATIDTTETPELREWADKDLADTVVEWYPKLVQMLPSPGYEAPTHFSITFRKNKPGVADTGGTRINCAESFFKKEMQGQGKGAIVHELVHVVQQYGAARRTNPHPNQNPGYLVEGIPDYLRWYMYEPQSHGTDISKRNFARANYDGSYRITANFLNYVVNKYDKNLIEELNTTMRQGNYTTDFWPTKTGKSIEDLNTEWKTDLALKLGPPAPTTMPGA